ncbi:hypothetical protein M747DRAFT_294226 [Aspergillus niger ATCC 13496]|uniref:Uncharacterized protein n=1 Tax=Aspergillus niger ATCC 13496 TaxID=1353008 RepID=A0A370C444_ASPNG|nr:hypothetical protein M747DRAFT_294226 [Aspergillus niger ATCC 13496]
MTPQPHHLSGSRSPVPVVLPPRGLALHWLDWSQSEWMPRGTDGKDTPNVTSSTYLDFGRYLQVGGKVIVPAAHALQLLCTTARPCISAVGNCVPTNLLRARLSCSCMLEG